MKLIAFLLRESRGVVVLSVLAGVVGGLSGVGLIALIHAELNRADASTRALGAAFAGLCVVMAMTRAASSSAMVRLAQGSVARLAPRLGRALLAVPLRRFEAIDSSALLAVLTEDVAIVANALVGIPLLCINVPIVLACLAFVGRLSGPVLALGLAVAVPGVVGYEILGARGARRLRLARAGQDELMGHFRSLIEGFRELKLHRGRREAFGEALGATTAAVRDHNVAAATLFALAGSWSLLAFFGFLGLILFALPALRAIDRSALAGAVLVVLYIMSPLEVILTWIPILSRARVSLMKIEALGLSLGDGDEPAGATAGPPAFESALELRGVTYAYHHKNDRGRAEFTLGPIDLTLRPEEVVFLVGGNGSGKTTLVKLLAGLYAPESGSIRLDGRAVAAEDRDAYRQLFTVVFADGHLFPTLRGLDPAGLDGRAREWLARLGLDDLVGVESGAFSTLDLSQGQRRRLALLGAILEDRPVVILDEWAANQDVPFKKIFYHELIPEWRARGKTLLVITHDDDYADAADRVVRLESGRLADGSRGEAVAARAYP